MAGWLTRHGRSMRGPLGRVPSRYDALLAVIPAAFLAAGVLGSVLPIPMRTAVAAASVVGMLAVADALFLNPPRGPRTGLGAGE